MNSPRTEPVPPARIQPYLVVKDAVRALQVYAQVFGFREVYRLPMGDGIGHAELELQGAKLLLSSEFPDMGVLAPDGTKGTSVSIVLYVEDVHAALARSLANGFVQEGEVKDEFYGDRTVKLRDPFGHHWFVNQRLETLDANEILRRFQALS